VELNGAAGAGGFTAAQAMRNGSWSVSGQLSIAGTGIQDVLARQFIVTSANTLRTYSQYNETSYADFVRADALRVGVPRAALEADAKTLVLRLSSGGANGIDFNFNGQTRFQAAAGGFNGTLALVKYAGGDIEILAPGAAASSKSGMISVYANDLNAVGASRLTVGSLPWVRYGQGGNHVVFDYWDGADSVFLRQGATLAAAEVLLVSSKTNGSIEIEAGASINTLGRGKAVYMPTTVSFTSRNPQCRGGFQWPVANAGADTRRNAAIRSRPDPGWSVQHRRLCRQYHLVFGRQHRVCHHEYLCTQ